MGHRMGFIRRPSSFLLIPVGSPAGICILWHVLWHVAAGQRAASVATRYRPRCRRLRSGSGESSAFRMRVEQEEGEPLRAEVGPARNRCKGGNVRTRLGLAVRHDVAACTPALGKVGAVTRICGDSSRGIKARDHDKQQEESSQTLVHPAHLMHLLAAAAFSRSTILEIARDRCGRRSTAAVCGPNGRDAARMPVSSPAGQSWPYRDFSYQGFRWSATRASPGGETLLYRGWPGAALICRKARPANSRRGS